jgi:small subunit ribosomal protein S18
MPRPVLRPPRKKVCVFCKDKTLEIDYKDTALLRKFVSDRGKIRPRGISGSCRQHQRDVAVAVKNARELALLPYAGLPTAGREPVERPRARSTGSRTDRAFERRTGPDSSPDFSSPDFGRGSGGDQPRGDPRGGTHGDSDMVQGVVKWFNSEQGFGFITPDGGGPEVFVRYAAIGAAGHRLLQENQRVSFAIVQGQKGPQARRVTPL